MPSDGLQLRPTIKDVVFVHIPKAAGTSLREMLVAALPDATKIFDYGTHTATIRGDFVNAFTSGADSPTGVLALRRTFKPVIFPSRGTSDRSTPRRSSLSCATPSTASSPPTSTRPAI
jgi:hypothetical protein